VITPVTLLTGFLGSGKTTLLSAIVRDPRFADTAIVVNEWGEAPIDHALLRRASGNVVAIAGGCICCRAAGDIVRALRELHFGRAAGRVAAFRRVVIETTGLAEPTPLLATLAELPLLAARYALSGVVTTVDAERGMDTLTAHPEAARQVAVADRIVVTKCDRAYRRAGSAAPERHDPEITSLARSAEEPLPWDGVEQALDTVTKRLGERLLRMKGLVHVENEPGPRAVHAAGHTLYPSARLAAWPDKDRATRIVFIGRGLEDAVITQIFESIRA
jgi:G3E family GTPase